MPIWAKGAIAIRQTRTRVPQHFVSPDGRVVFEVRHHARKGDDDSLYLHLTKPQNDWDDVNLDRGANELLWAPDSSAVLVNGSTSAYAGFFTTVYQFGPDEVRKLILTEAAQRDMVATFPPCKALNRDQALCNKIASDPKFNMSGLSWISPSRIVVIGEIPCSSAYGGIMCQIQGYVLNVPDGAIVERLSARELKMRWQKSMAWSMRIPDAPEYGPALKNDNVKR